MKEDWTHLEEFRRQHPMGETKAGDRYGHFVIPAHDRNERLRYQTQFMVIATDGDNTGWEHVSIHVRYRDGIDPKMRTPRWDEMCHIKGLFWGCEEAVIQFHPASSTYVNQHDHVLHLWKYTKGEFPLPSTMFV